MSLKQPSKSVFVGNIPYGLTEEQITDIFSSAGKVISFRLVYDRETGRPKGFGFAEYPDSDSAASAVRNLNDFEIMNRKLRVDFSNDGAEDEAAASGGYIPSNGLPVPPPLVASHNGTSSTLPPLPQGVDLPLGLTCPDAISRTLNTLPPAQLLDVLSQMKALVSTDPSKATELLRQAPQLSYAIFQALLLMGLVSADALAGVVEQPVTSAPPAVQVAPPQQHQQYAPPPIPGQGGFPAGFPPPPPQYGTPPGHGIAYPPPPPVQQYQPRQQAPVTAPPEQNEEDLLAQVLAMPMELVDQLPPAERAQIMALRTQYGSR